MDPLAVSHDERWVAGALGRMVWVVNAADGLVRWSFETGSHSVRMLAFSPDDARLYCIGEHGVSAWRLSDGQRELRVAVPQHIPKAGLSADGRTLLVDAHQSQYFVDTATGAVTVTRATQSNTSYENRIAPVFTADGRYAITSDIALRAWNLATGEVTVLEDHSVFMHACAVGEGAHIIVAGPDRTLARYDVSDGRKVASVRVPNVIQGLFTVGDSVWVHAQSSVITQWEVTAYDPDALEAREGVPTLRVPSYATIALARDAVWSSHNGWLNALSTAAPTSKPYPSRGACQSVRFDRSATHVAAVFGTTSERSALRWSVATGERVGAYHASDYTLLYLAADGASVCGDWAYTAASATRAALDDARSAEAFDPNGQHGTVYVPDDAERVIAIDPKRLRVLPDGPTYELPKKHKLGAFSAWEIDGELVVSHDYKRITAFDLRKGEYIAPEAFTKIRAMCPVGERVWVASDKSVALWDVRARAKVRTVKFTLPQWQYPRSCAATRDGRMLAIGASSGDLLLLELDGDERALTFRASRAGAVSACAFSDDGALLATGGAEPFLCVWDVAVALASAPATDKIKKKPAEG